MIGKRLRAWSRDYKQAFNLDLDDRTKDKLAARPKMLQNFTFAKRGRSRVEVEDRDPLFPFPELKCRPPSLRHADEHFCLQCRTWSTVPFAGTEHA